MWDPNYDFSNQNTFTGFLESDLYTFDELVEAIYFLDQYLLALPAMYPNIRNRILAKSVVIKFQSASQDFIVNENRKVQAAELLHKITETILTLIDDETLVFPVPMGSSVLSLLRRSRNVDNPDIKDYLDSARRQLEDVHAILILEDIDGKSVNLRLSARLEDGIENIKHLVAKSIEIIEADDSIDRHLKRKILKRLNELSKLVASGNVRWDRFFGILKPTIIYLGAIGSLVGGANSFNQAETVLLNVEQIVCETTFIAPDEFPEHIFMPSSSGELKLLPSPNETIVETKSENTGKHEYPDTQNDDDIIDGEFDELNDEDDPSPE